VKAEEAGADRLELCGPGEGGLTPSIEVILEVTQAVKIPVHVMIRPRAGDFNYSDVEFEQMIGSIQEIKTQTIAKGVVFGILNPDHSIDTERMKTLCESARPLRIVCHKAFDETPDADSAINTLMELGIDEVLTSGHCKTAVEGASALSNYRTLADGNL
jgi:copper homeostasis protein